MTAALAAGGREHFGWGLQTHLMAGLLDAINQNTRATGNWKKKAPDIPPVPRPSARAVSRKATGKQTTLVDLQRKLMGGGR